MKDTLISFETAKLAKEKGFVIPNSTAYVPMYYEGDSIYLSEGQAEDQCVDDRFVAASQAYLQTWLRDMCGRHIVLIPVVTMGYTFKLMKVWKKDFDPNLTIEEPPYKEVHAYDYNSYEEALEEGLKAALNTL